MAEGIAIKQMAEENVNEYGRYYIILDTIEVQHGEIRCSSPASDVARCRDRNISLKKRCAKDIIHPIGCISRVGIKGMPGAYRGANILS
jgi:hypothetical protein